MTAALHHAALHRGLEIREGNVTDLILKDKVVSGVVTDGEEILSGAVVIAGGAWSGDFARPLVFFYLSNHSVGKSFTLHCPTPIHQNFPS